MKNPFLKPIGLLALAVLICAALLAGLSLNFPHLLGKERLWDLNTGRYTDAVFVCGLKLSERKVTSGLEPIFADQVRARQTGFPQVVIYSSSILQPARGGQSMRVAHLVGRFMTSSHTLTTSDRERLLGLIHAQDAIELRRWYYERESGGSK